jgi:hypothetical protein
MQNNNESRSIYVGSGKQTSPNDIEVLIYPDDLREHIKETAKGRRIAVLILSKRKEAGAYGETHTLRIKLKKQEDE